MNESGDKSVQPATKMVHGKEVPVPKTPPGFKPFADVDPVEATKLGMKEATRRAIERSRANLERLDAETSSA